MRWTSILLLPLLFAQAALAVTPYPSMGQYPLPPQNRPITGHGGSFGGGTLPNSGVSVTPPQSYSDYYSNSLKTYQRPPVNAQDYTIQKYFYQRPTLSPYLNLTRRPSTVGPGNYFQYVLPEVERRARVLGLD